MVKLHALVSAYQCDDTIYECLEALSKFCDRIVILEGRFLGYCPEKKSIRSDDRTLPEIEKFLWNQPVTNRCAVKLILLSENLPHHLTKNILISQVPEGDWWLYIDSDEVVKKIPDNLHEVLEALAKKKVKGIRVAMFETPQLMSQSRVMDNPRIFKKTAGMWMTTNHRYLDDDEGEIRNYIDMPTLPDFIIEHKRFKKMRNESERYKRWLREYEKQQGWE